MGTPLGVSFVLVETGLMDINVQKHLVTKQFSSVFFEVISMTNIGLPYGVSTH
jgi:hypothetical protein